MLLLWQFFVAWLTLYYVLFVVGIIYVMVASSPCEKVRAVNARKSTFWVVNPLLPTVLCRPRARLLPVPA